MVKIKDIKTQNNNIFGLELKYLSKKKPIKPKKIKGPTMEKLLYAADAKIIFLKFSVFFLTIYENQNPFYLYSAKIKKSIVYFKN